MILKVHGNGKKVSTLGQKSTFLQGYSLASERYDLDSLKIHRQTIQVLIASSCWHLLDMSSGGPAKPVQLPAQNGHRH